jgi:hypothetical protein
MRVCNRLKNINSVSGKLGERHFDPFLPLAADRFREAISGTRLRYGAISGKFIFRRNAL